MERKDVIKMDTIIQVKCIDQTLTLINSPVIASGGLNENKLECDFCEKWDGFSKTAVFYQDKKNVYYSVLDENDTCIIPKEATASKGTMCFGIFGSKGDVTRTSEVLRYKIDEGAITEDLKPSDPTPDIYEQILAKLQEIREAEATFETKITEQQENYESDLNTQWSTYKTDLTKHQNEFETHINEQQSTFQTDITNQEGAFEAKISKQQNDYETDLSGQWSTYKTETDKEIAEKLSKVYRMCGSVANYEALPTDAEIGDVYNLLDTGVNWAWTGTEWDSLAGIIDISNYYNKTEVDTKLNTETTNRTNADNTLQSNIDKNYTSIQNIISGAQNVGNAVKFGGTKNEVGTHCTSTSANIVCEYFGTLQYLLASEIVQGSLQTYDGGKNVYELRTTGFYHINGELANGPQETYSAYSWAYCNVLIIRGGDVLHQIVFPFNSSNYFAMKTSYGIDGGSEKWGSWKLFQSVQCSLIGNDLYINI